MLHQLTNGNKILRFIPCQTIEHPQDDLSTPLLWSMVILSHRHQYILLHHTQRQQWESPGGGIEAGETCEDCAIREVWEETGQQVEYIEPIGLCKIWIEAKQQDEYFALYAADVDELLPFTPNEESDRITLWQQGQPLDDRLGELCQVMMDYAAGFYPDSQF